MYFKLVRVELKCVQYNIFLYKNYRVELAGPNGIYCPLKMIKGDTYNGTKSNRKDRKKKNEQWEVGTLAIGL